MRSAPQPLPGWIYYCYNTGHPVLPVPAGSPHVRICWPSGGTARRDATAYVIDLYAGDLTAQPNAVSSTDAHLDRTGYCTLGRKDPDRNWQPRTGSWFFFGGLRWQVSKTYQLEPPRDRPDRAVHVGSGPETADDFFSRRGYNACSCRGAWPPRPASPLFQTLGLRSNPGHRHCDLDFRWHSSTRSAGTAETS